MKLEEMKSQLEAKTVEIRAFIAAKDVEKAEEGLSEKRTLEKLIAAQEELEETEKRTLESQREKKKEFAPKEDETNEFRCIVKEVMGMETTVEERANIKSTDNAAVLPKQFINQLQEYKKGYGSLKEYCDVIQVSKNEGTIPVANIDQNTFPEVAEGDNIVDGTLVTTEVAFKCAKHGLIQSLTAELVDDAEIEIENLARKNFAELVTVAENTKIIKVITTSAVTYDTPTSYEDIQKTLDTASPGVRNGLVTITNVEGFAHLKNLKDNEKRPLNLVTELGGKYYFHGKELVVVDTALLPATPLKKVFYVCNTRELIKYCDRKAVTVARSAEAGFRDDTIKLRILERFAVVKGVARHCYKIEY